MKGLAKQGVKKMAKYAAKKAGLYLLKFVAYMTIGSFGGPIEGCATFIYNRRNNHISCRKSNSR